MNDNVSCISLLLQGIKVFLKIQEKGKAFKYALPSITIHILELKI